MSTEQRVSTHTKNILWLFIFLLSSYHYKKFTFWDTCTKNSPKCSLTKYLPLHSSKRWHKFSKYMKHDAVHKKSPRTKICDLDYSITSNENVKILDNILQTTSGSPCTSFPALLDSLSFIVDCTNSAYCL